MDGLRDGMGTMFYKKGDRYEGEWKNDMREGQGTLWTVNKAKYTGTFKADKKQGHGEIVTKEGIKYKENWMNGLLISHFKVEETSP